MKRLQIYIVLLMAGMALFSCEEKFKVETPSIVTFSYDPVPAVAGEIVTFQMEVDAQQAVIWYGFEGSDYELNQTAPNHDNTGTYLSLELNDSTGLYTTERAVRYAEPGTYHVALIATNVGEFGEVILQATKEMDLVVEPAPAE